MNTTDRLQELLLGWQDFRDSDKNRTAEELCAECPELVPLLKARIRAVLAMEAVMEPLTSIKEPNPKMPASTDHGQQAKTDDESDGTESNAAGTGTSAGTRFRILRPHAKGGLGEVSVALDTELNREVALKEIQSKHADNDDSRARFLLEAEITGGLEHPSIVPVYGLGTYADGRPFYAMRFIRGDSLMDAIKRFHQGNPGPIKGRLDGDRAVELHKLVRRLIDVCDALQYAHDRGVLHRDIKPGNIMLGKYGETLVVDWGLAKATEKAEPGGSTAGGEGPLRPASASGSAETVAGTAIGTPAYMSPEQAEGRLDILGPATDVYSLGATLYTLLTGKSPAAGTLVDVMKKVRTGDIESPGQLDSSIDTALEAVCLKAMALRPSDRYASPRQMANDLERWLAYEPVSAWPEPWTVKARRFVARNRVLVTGAAAAVLVALVSLGVATLLLQAANEDLIAANQQEEKAKNAAQQANMELNQANADLGNSRNEALVLAKKEQEANKQLMQVNLDLDKERTNALSLAKKETAARTRVQQELRRSEVLLYHSQFREALSQFDRHDLEGARNSLDECRWNFRGPEYGNLARQIAKTATPLFGHIGEVTSLALAGDGKWLYSASGDNTIKMWDLETGKEELTLRGHSARVTSLALAADGKQLYSGSLDNTIKVWNLKTGKEPLTLRGHKKTVLNLAITADSKRLYSASDDNTIKMWDLETGKEALTLRGHVQQVTSLALAADGKQLYSGSLDSTIKVWDLEKGKETLTLRGHALQVTSLAVVADGKRLYSASRDATIKVWDLEAGKETLTLRGHAREVSSLALMADGKRFFSGSLDRTIKLWDLDAGQETLTLRGHADAVWSLALAADGKRLYSASRDATIKVWDLEAGKETRTLRGHSARVTSLALAADGKRLYSASTDATIKLWDLDTGKETLTLRGHSKGIANLALAANGKRLYSASEDTTIKVWDLEAGKEILTLRGHTGMVWSLALSADGKRLYSGGKDNSIKVWDLDAGKGNSHPARAHRHGCEPGVGGGRQTTLLGEQ